MIGWWRHFASAFRPALRSASICCARCMQCRKPRSRSGFVARPWRIGSRPRVLDRHKQQPQLTDPRVEIPAELRTELAAASSRQRRLQSRSLRRPWAFASRSRSTPGRRDFPAQRCRISRRILSAIGANVRDVLSRALAAPSRLERIWKEQYTGSGRNVVRDYVRLCDLDDEDLDWFAAREDLQLTPEHYGRNGIPRFVAVDEELMGLLGFYLAEGSCSDRNGIRLSIGKGNQRFAEEMAKKFTSVFGLPAVTYSSPQRCTELKLVNRVAALAWQHVFGFADVRLHHQADSGSGVQRFRGSAMSPSCAAICSATVPSARIELRSLPRRTTSRAALSIA